MSRPAHPAHPIRRPCFLEKATFLKDVKHQEEVTRDFLEGPEAQDKVTRLALLNIWNHIDLTDFTEWKQTEPEIEFFASSRSNETLPDENFEAVDLPKDRKIKGNCAFLNFQG